MPIGEIIRGARERRGVSQKELADAVDLTSATIRKYETGGILNIPIDKLVLIVRYLGIPGENLGITAGFSFPERAKLMHDLCKEMEKMEEKFTGLKFNYDSETDDEKSYRKGLHDGYHAAIHFILTRSTIKREEEY